MGIMTIPPPVGVEHPGRGRGYFSPLPAAARVMARIKLSNRIKECSTARRRSDQRQPLTADAAQLMAELPALVEIGHCFSSAKPRVGLLSSRIVAVVNGVCLRRLDDFAFELPRFVPSVVALLSCFLAGAHPPIHAGSHRKSADRFRAVSLAARAFYKSLAQRNPVLARRLQGLLGMLVAWSAPVCSRSCCSVSANLILIERKPALVSSSLPVVSAFEPSCATRCRSQVDWCRKAAMRDRQIVQLTAGGAGTAAGPRDGRREILIDFLAGTGAHHRCPALRGYLRAEAIWRVELKPGVVDFETREVGACGFGGTRVRCLRDDPRRDGKRPQRPEAYCRDAVRASFHGRIMDDAGRPG